MNVWMGMTASAVRIAEDTEFDPNKVSPGVEGFLLTALMAGAVILLGFLLVTRLRRNTYRREVHEQIEEELERAAGTAPGGASTSREDLGSAEPGSTAPGSATEGGADHGGTDSNGDSAPPQQ